TPELPEVLHLIESGHFSNGDKELFRPLLENLTGRDPFFVLADFSDYLRAQNAINATWADRSRWNRMAIKNAARSGFFSSDRAIREYAQRIWDVQPSPVAMTGGPGRT
ncbi:glycogen/starch/alpha-glucan phosphorylase, partial [Cyanobium sp. Candia 9D4]|uniref:glycogen/starch/alpha-glucan phosphorylase n=1 Tax=Cyanobium sp. Candia 9D4 TaxID=2823707 RepID=UPI0020CE201B